MPNCGKIGTYSIHTKKPEPLGQYAGTKNTGKTDADGRFVDAPVGRYFPNPFTESAKQKLFIQVPGVSNPTPVGSTSFEIGNASIKITYEAPKGVAGPPKQVILVKR